MNVNICLLLAFGLGGGTALIMTAMRFYMARNVVNGITQYVVVSALLVGSSFLLHQREDAHRLAPAFIVGGFLLIALIFKILLNRSIRSPRI